MNNAPALAVIVSDAVETCGVPPQKIPAPSSNVQIILILLPTKNKGKGITSAQQFQVRCKKIHKNAPWIQIIPPFAFSLNLFEKNDNVRPVKAKPDRHINTVSFNNNGF